MWQRIFFGLITLFFIVMNVLLWRSEFPGRRAVGSPVPVSTVWRKVITAPDISSLEIRHQGQKIGFSRWIPTVGEKPGTARTSEAEPPEGMVREPTGYNLDFNGHVAMDEENLLRFHFDLELGTNSAWQQFTLRLTLRPNTLDVKAIAAAQTVTFGLREGGRRTERVVKFSDLRNPERLLQELGGPLLPATLTALGIPLKPADPTPPNPGLDWQARHDWLKVGYSRVRVYRLQCRLLDRYAIVAWISPVGEVLRVELPNDVLLLSDALTSL